MTEPAVRQVCQPHSKASSVPEARHGQSRLHEFTGNRDSVILAEYFSLRPGVNVNLSA